MVWFRSTFGPIDTYVMFNYYNNVNGYIHTEYWLLIVHSHLLFFFTSLSTKIKYNEILLLIFSKLINHFYLAKKSKFSNKSHSFFVVLKERKKNMSFSNIYQKYFQFIKIHVSHTIINSELQPVLLTVGCGSRKYQWVQQLSTFMSNSYTICSETLEYWSMFFLRLMQSLIWWNI